MTERLRVDGVEKSFGTTRVLRGVTLTVGAGEAVGLCGPNGSGKTTLSNVISGLGLPDRGKVLFEGRDVTRLSMDARFRMGISRTFQIPDPYPSLTVLDSVRVALLCGRTARGGQGPSGGRREEELEAILLRTGLFAQRFWPAAGLSQGCLRRLEFARAIACRPRLLLLDEVFSALSAKDESELAALLRSLNRDEGVSVLLISHNPMIIEEMCERVAVIEDGRIVWEGTPADLPKHLPVPSPAGPADVRSGKEEG